MRRVPCPQTDDLELKKLVYLYLINYAKTKPDLTLLVRCASKSVFASLLRPGVAAGPQLGSQHRRTRQGDACCPPATAGGQHVREGLDAGP